MEIYVYTEEEISFGKFVAKGLEWIDKESVRRQPRLDLFGEERRLCDLEYQETERVLSNISNVLLNGAVLLLDHVFDSVGFNGIEDVVFRQLVKARLSYPASKAATVEYLKNHFDEDLNLSKIYRYLDKLSDRQHEIVQDISVRHTRKILGGACQDGGMPEHSYRRFTSSCRYSRKVQACSPSIWTWWN